ncbi:hypothetical protein BDAP_001524 [Binucleata daphniae]
MSDILALKVKKILEGTERKTELAEVLKIIENDPPSAIYFWEYNGIPIVLMQEMINAYQTLNTDGFTDDECTRLCTTLNIFQVLLHIKSIKEFFIDASLAFYLYPFLNVTDTSQRYENLRIASLGVVATFLSINDNTTIELIKNTEIIPLTLKIMDLGSEVSKILALHVFLKIIENKEGMEYVCQTFDRFLAISVILNSMLYQCITTPSIKLVEYILDCYIKLTEKENVKMIYRNKKPDAFTNAEITKQMQEDPLVNQKYEKFMKMIGHF